MVCDRWEPDQRDILLDQVRRGEITPDQAEQKASVLGLEPFEIRGVNSLQRLQRQMVTVDEGDAAKAAARCHPVEPRKSWGCG